MTDAQRPSRPLRILLAEDAPQNQMLLVTYFESTPHQLDIADNGQVAVEKFVAGAYDLVLMNLQMPVVDGYAATREIRRAEAERMVAATPIVALTARARAEDLANSRQAGCTDHLTTPLNLALLGALVERYARAPGAVRFVVLASGDTPELIPDYLAITRADLVTGLTALARGDLRPLQALGHKLKSSGAGYGLDAIGEIGRRLERYAAAGSTCAVGQHAASLQTYLDRLEVVYE